MVEVSIAEYFGMAEALGIIGTMFVVLYFSRKQMQSKMLSNEYNLAECGSTAVIKPKPELFGLIFKEQPIINANDLDM